MNNKSSKSILNECINNYKVDVNSLLFRIHELEIFLGSSNDSDIIQSDSQKITRINREKLISNKDQSKKSNKRTDRCNKKVVQSLDDKYKSLLLENRKLKEEIKIKNEMIHEKDEILFILTDQNANLTNVSQECIENQNISCQNIIDENQNNNKSSNRDNSDIENTYLICQMMNELKNANSSLNSTVKYQNQLIDQLKSENESLKKLQNQANNHLIAKEDSNAKMHSLKEKLRRVEKEKKSLHDLIDQHEITIEKLKAQIQELKEENKNLQNFSDKNQENKIVQKNNHDFLRDKKSEFSENNNSSLNQSKNDDMNYIALNPIKISDEKQILNNNDDNNIFLFPFKKNDPKNFNININLQIQKNEVQQISEECIDEIEFIEEEEEIPEE